MLSCSGAVDNSLKPVKPLTPVCITPTLRSDALLDRNVLPWNMPTNHDLNNPRFPDFFESSSSAIVSSDRQRLTLNNLSSSVLVWDPCRKIRGQLGSSKLNHYNCYLNAYKCLFLLHFHCH